MTIGFGARKASMTLAAAALSAAGLAGCGELNMRQELGLVGQGPDAFDVVVQKPLVIPNTIPADPAALPEPQPGAPSLVEPRPLEDAQRLFGASPSSSATAAPSGSESALLTAAGASGADPSVRAALAADQAAKEDEIRLLDRLFGRDRKTEGQVLDAEAEARRLAEAASQGKNPGLIVPPPAPK